MVVLCLSLTEVDHAKERIGCALSLRNQSLKFGNSFEYLWNHLLLGNRRNCKYRQLTRFTKCTELSTQS